MLYEDDLEVQYEKQLKNRRLLILIAFVALILVLASSAFVIVGPRPDPPKEPAIAQAKPKRQPAAEPPEPRPVFPLPIPSPSPPEKRPQRTEEFDDDDLPVIPRKKSPPPKVETYHPAPPKPPDAPNLLDPADVADEPARGKSELADWRKKLKPVETGTPPEEKPIPVPGKLLKEIVPGFETRQIQGFLMLLSTQAIKEAKRDGGKPFEALLVEFDNLVKVLPPGTLRTLRRVRIWVEWDKIDPENPNIVAKYYGGNIWLLDRSEHFLKSNSIEVLSLKRLSEEVSRSIERPRLVMLHELAHSAHHLVVGFENPVVLATYKQAMDRRLYDRVQDTAGGVGPAYARTNAREYFAELTCAYLDRCQQFPFTHDELKDHDPTGFRLMEKVWGKRPPIQQSKEKEK